MHLFYKQMFLSVIFKRFCKGSFLNLNSAKYKRGTQNAKPEKSVGGEEMAARWGVVAEREEGSKTSRSLVSPGGLWPSLGCGGLACGVWGLLGPARNGLPNPQEAELCPQLPPGPHADWGCDLAPSHCLQPAARWATGFLGRGFQTAGAHQTPFVTCCCLLFWLNSF